MGYSKVVCVFGRSRGCLRSVLAAHVFGHRNADALGAARGASTGAGRNRGRRAGAKARRTRNAVLAPGNRVPLVPQLARGRVVG